MKIFAIRDAADRPQKNLAYLLYYEAGKCFYIELPEGADPWALPMPLSAFARKGEYTIDAYWSKTWVQQRIVPPDRQNIAQILRDNGLKAYDEFSLLMLASGRCEQDDYYLAQVGEEALPEEIRERFSRRIGDAAALRDSCLLVFFRDGTVRKCDLTAYFKQHRAFSVLLNRPDYFDRVRVQPGGYGVQWDENLAVSNELLYRMGRQSPLPAEDFEAFASQGILTGAEAADLLNCSRQYVNELVKAGKLHPVKASGKNTLFFRSEVLTRLWE